MFDRFRFLSLAQTTEESFRTTEYDLPQTSAGMLILLLVTVVLIGLTVFTSLRDTRFLKTGWRATLLTLRLLVVILVLVIALNPQSRTQVTRTQPSRVGVLVDTSSSMSYPSEETAESATAQQISRATAVQQAFVDSGVLKKLSETHAVSFFTFDETLKGPQAISLNGQTTFVEPEKENTVNADSANPATTDSSNSTPRIDLKTPKTKDEKQQWQQILQPQGGETRFGEALHQLVGDLSGRTLSGIVVLTDGRSNAGLDPEVAALRAARSNTNVIIVGLGSRVPQVNLWLAGMQSPSDVHRGDPFDINVVLQGLSLEEQTGKVKLYQQSAGSTGDDRKQVAEQTFQMPAEKRPVEVKFQQQISVPGKYEYVAVAELANGSLKELTLEDNQRRREIEVTDRKQKVLVISSGPMRDYQFVRNSLYRHSGIDSDVWLQTVTDENINFVSQESTRLLTEFPKDEAALFEYDVIVGFDVDWSRLSEKQQQYLNRWVDQHSGGIVFVAGEINTPELARTPNKFTDILSLYPVVPNRMLSDLKVSQGTADSAWPILLTTEGKTSEFLKISDATGKSDVELWKRFQGIFRSYPVKSVKDGAIVLAEYGNPRASTRDGLPPWLASQFYGKGRAIFLGSAETWRLRSISPEGHQRFWTSLIREVGAGRRKRGRSRGLLLLDKTETSPGQSVTIRAQVYDARMQPLQRETLPLSITDGEGRPVNVPSELRPDGRRPGQFINVFRPARPGVYRIKLPIPESSDELIETIEVVLPNLESEDPSQNVPLLTRFSEQAEGNYLSLKDAVAKLPDLLPNRSEPIIIDDKLQTLWDRGWLMFLMIFLLGLEWALRRVVRLS